MNKQLGPRDLDWATVVKHMPTDVLSEFIGRRDPGSPGHTAGMAEMERRGLAAVTAAAEATKHQADWTRRSAIIAIAAVFVAIVAIIVPLVR